MAIDDHDRLRAATSRRAVLQGLSALGVAAVPLADACARSSTGATPAPTATPLFRRGIGISHPMGWADVGPDGAFAFPPFTGRGREFGAAQMQALRRAGIDFVRLAVDPGPFLQFRGSRREWMNRRLCDTVRSIVNGGLGVVVDLHPSNLQPDYASEALTRGTGDATFRSYLALLTWTAGNLDRLRRRSGATAEEGARPRPPLALELMNEPEIEAGAWQPMLAAAYKAARGGTSDLPLVLGGGQQNSVEALLAIDTSPFDGDPALIYTFHDYEPWQFTHQGAQGNPAFFLTDVPYPASGGSLRATVAATNERIQQSRLDSRDKAAEQKAALERLDVYRRTAYDRRARDARYDRVAKWAERRGVSKDAILLGEFGVHRTPYQAGGEGSASRDRWFSETRAAAEAHGFGWSAWVYSGPGGFALAEHETGPALDQSIVDDLGLGHMVPVDR